MRYYLIDVFLFPPLSLFLEQRSDQAGPTSLINVSATQLKSVLPLVDLLLLRSTHVIGQDGPNQEEWRCQERPPAGNKEKRDASYQQQHCSSNRNKHGQHRAYQRDQDHDQAPKEVGAVIRYTSNSPQNVEGGVQEVDGKGNDNANEA
jgi:hypothetical protein